MNRILARVMGLVGLLAVVMAAYFLWARPYQLRWGASEAEIGRPIPGDELVGNATFLATRGITIDGAPEEIWPWLVQMGHGRAGFYGYDILENLGSERGLRSAESILPELQDFEVGDEVPISSVASMVFHAIEPNRFLVWSSRATEDPPSAFTWSLYPIDEKRTRLISRIRWSYHWTEPTVLPLELFTEFTDHIAVRKILQGVEDRVEGRVESMVVQNVEFAIYVSALLVLLTAAMLSLLRPLTWKTWSAGLAAGGSWLLVWYAPMPSWSAAALVLLTALTVHRTSRGGIPPEEPIYQETDARV